MVIKVITIKLDEEGQALGVGEQQGISQPQRVKAQKIEQKQQEMKEQEKEKKEIKRNEEEGEKPVLPATSKTTEFSHGGDESTGSIENSPNPSNDGEEEKDQAGNQENEKNEERNYNNSVSENNQQQPSSQTTSQQSENSMSITQQSNETTSSMQRSGSNSNNEDGENNDSNADITMDDAKGQQNEQDDESKSNNSQDNETNEESNNDTKENNGNDSENEEEKSEDDSDEENKGESEGTEEDNDNEEGEDYSGDDEEEEESDEDDDYEDSDEDEEQEHSGMRNSIQVFNVDQQGLPNLRLRTALWRFIDFVADEKVGYSNDFKDKVIMKYAIKRVINHYPISHAYGRFEKEKVAIIFDNSGSMSWVADVVDDIFYVLKDRADVMFFIAPNGNIEEMYVKNKGWIPVDHESAIELLKNVTVIYFGDYDGADTPIELSWYTRVYWFCPESRYRRFLSHDWVHYSEDDYKGIFARVYDENEIIRAIDDILQRIFMQRLFLDYHEDETFYDDND